MYELIVLFVLPHILNATSSDQIFTTYRDDGNNTIWDGKWTFLQEWKRTSLATAYGENFVIRVGHDYKSLYVFLDLLSQQKITKYSDYAIVCITSDMDLEERLKNDNHCYFVTQGSNNPLTFQGGGILGSNNYLIKIKNDPNLIAVGGISSESDRYTSVPHTSYEFRIPINDIGRSDVYRFYTSVYDSNENKVYSWPESLPEKVFPNIPSPSSWGQVISPDKSLPEFPLANLTMIFAFILIFFFTWKRFLSIPKL